MGRSLGVVAVLVSLSRLFAQDAIPEKTLQELKDATVFIQVNLGGMECSGSGFLMRRDGDVGFIVTNAHVVSERGSADRSVTVVFRSGAKGETSATAQVVSEDADRDLAILKVNLSGLPSPIDLSSQPKLRETLPVYMLGFPFGQALSASHGNPAVTIGKGIISSIRMDDLGNLAVIQIDGDLNPGNSGGPIVDAKGSLIGVAVAKVFGTRIGMAIPPRELEEMLLGRVEGVDFDPQENKDGTVKFQVKARLIDPMGKMKGVSVLLIPKDKVKGEPQAGADGAWAALPGARECTLKIQGDGASGEVVLKSDAKEDVAYLFQMKYVRGDGKARITQPGDLLVEFSQGVAAAAPPPKKAGGDDDWLGSGKDKAERKAAAEGKVLETGEELAGETKTVVDASVTTLKVDAKNTLPNLVWSSDGKYLYLLEKRGMLRKIACPGFKEEMVFPIAQSCSWIERSKEGLLVMLDDLQEIWVIGEAKLGVVRRIPAAGIRKVASSPALSVAYGASDRDVLSVIDLKAGKVVKQLSANRIQHEQGKKIRRHKDGVVLCDWSMVGVTPDGAYLFAVSFECLHRFRIKGTDLAYEEMGPRIGSNPQRIEITSDSAYVALPSGGGNGGPSDHPKLNGYGTYVYKVGDLQMPVMSITSGPYPRALAFDKPARMVYAENHDHQLLTFTPDGMKQKEYVLAPDTGEARQLLVRPEGSSLLILTENALYWVELPK